MASQLKVLMVILAAFIGLAGCSRAPKDAALIESGKQYFAKKDYARAALQFRNAIQANPKNSEAHYQMALAQLGIGDKILAYRELSRAVDLDPKNMAAQLKMAELLVTSSAKGEIEQSQEYAQTVLDASPDDPRALDAMATAELKLGNPEESLALLERASSKAPEHLQTAVMLATARLRLKDKTGAEQVLRQAVEKAPESLQGLAVLGSFYLVIGKNQEGESVFHKVLDKDPNNALALLDLAIMLNAEGRKNEAEEMYRRLAAGASPYKSTYATYLFRNGRQKEAVAELERLARLEPKDVELRTRLVAAYLDSKRMEDAQRILNAVLAKNPKDSAALLQRSELRRMDGAFADARKDLMSALPNTTDRAKAYFLLAVLDRAEGSPLKERQDLSECLQLNPRYFPARIALAQGYIVAGEGRTAVDVMNQAPDDQKNGLRYVETRNWGLLAAGDVKELRKGIDQGLAKARSRNLLMQDGLLKLWEGKRNEGLSAFLEILKSNPEDLGAVDVLVRVYNDQQQLPAAIEQLRRLVTLRPRSAQLQHRLGAALAAAGKSSEAYAAFKAALSADPHYSAAQLAMAQLDRAEGKTDTARLELEPLLSSKDVEISARIELGAIEVKAGNYAKAIEHFRKSVEADPGNVVALNNLADLLTDHTDQTDEALKYARMAKERAPNDVTVDDTLGWAYFRKGLYGPALQHLQNAVDREEKNAVNGAALRRYHLAMAYIKTGDQARAAKALDAALRLDPNLPEATVARRMQAGSK